MTARTERINLCCFKPPGLWTRCRSREEAQDSAAPALQKPTGRRCGQWARRRWGSAQGGAARPGPLLLQGTDCRVKTDSAPITIRVHPGCAPLALAPHWGPGYSSEGGLSPTAQLDQIGMEPTEPRCSPDPEEKRASVGGRYRLRPPSGDPVRRSPTSRAGVGKGKCASPKAVG